MRVLSAAEQRPWTRHCPTCGHDLDSPKPVMTLLPYEPEPDEVRRQKWATCDRFMHRTGERCGRKAGHGGYCRSRDSLDREALRRRKVGT